MNVKHIAATLAILGSASFSLAGCNKGKEGTEVPGAGATEKKEGSCGEKKDGNCGGDKAAEPAAEEPAAE